MCKFCESTESEKKAFYEWKNCDPYEGDEQVSWEGIDLILDGKQFIAACNFDGGYIGDAIEITFNYCPMCGRKI